MSLLPLPRCDVSPGLGSEAQLLPLCSSKRSLASWDPLGPGKGEFLESWDLGVGGGEVGGPGPWAKGRIRIEDFCRAPNKTDNNPCLTAHTSLWGKQSNAHRTEFIICQSVISAMEKSEARKSGEWEL